jgi:hypothetical protein
MDLSRAPQEAAAIPHKNYIKLLLLITRNFGQYPRPAIADRFRAFDGRAFFHPSAPTSL